MAQRTVLIVDDDSDDRTLFINAVREIDELIYCYFASDGQAALNLLSELKPEKPDLIFLDLYMPVLDGRATLIAIKNDSATSSIPVIIYSISKSSDESAELKQLGAVHFISKPSNPEEIYFVVSAVLEEQFLLLRSRPGNDQSPGLN